MAGFSYRRVALLCTQFASLLRSHPAQKQPRKYGACSRSRAQFPHGCWVQAEYKWTNGEVYTDGFPHDRVRRACGEERRVGLPHHVTQQHHQTGDPLPPCEGNKENLSLKQSKKRGTKKHRKIGGASHKSRSGQSTSSGTSSEESGVESAVFNYVMNEPNVLQSFITDSPFSFKDPIFFSSVPNRDEKFSKKQHEMFGGAPIKSKIQLFSKDQEEDKTVDVDTETNKKETETV